MLLQKTIWPNLLCYASAFQACQCNQACCQCEHTARLRNPMCVNRRLGNVGPQFASPPLCRYPGTG